MSIRDNYLTVMENIASACAECGRSEGEVKLITVTKFVDTGRIAEAVAAGARHVGENRAQEFRDKLDFFKENGLDAHLIGPAASLPSPSLQYSRRYTISSFQYWTV